MSKYSKFNIIYILQKWMESVAGQTFMNYAYSWGASVVILGTLFKLTHLPGANVMLFIGMGTEVFVFFIAAFDRPFDKTSDGKALATDTELAQQLGMVSGIDDDDVVIPAVSAQPQIVVGGTVAGGGVETGVPAEGISSGVVVGGPVVGGPVVSGPVVVGGSLPSADGIIGDEDATAEASASAGGTVVVGGNGGGYIGAPAPAVSPETAEAMEDVTKTYIDRLEQLNETLLKVSALSEKLSIDSEEMENLNRTLTGIARVYEMQLKSASQQITTQDDINAQTKKMAESIAELNSCYARMIEAMKVNVG